MICIILCYVIVVFEQAPLETDLVLYLTQDGIKLVFDPVTQRLKLIHVVNMKLVRLTYWSVFLL